MQKVLDKYGDKLGICGQCVRDSVWFRVFFIVALFTPIPIISICIFMGLLEETLKRNRLNKK